MTRKTWSARWKSLPRHLLVTYGTAGKNAWAPFIIYSYLTLTLELVLIIHVNLVLICIKWMFKVDSMLNIKLGNIVYTNVLNKTKQNIILF